MSEAQWSLQDAKNKFSAVVEAARRGKPQVVTKRGIPAVVVISAEEYERLRQLRGGTLPSFRDHLLAMPQDGGAFERADLTARDMEL
jgi:antitoxin Phd